ncbi:MAG: ATP-binding protein [Proteobacteria bacterium]|nr:MAG: ATP-binding protein [Pseudomonadota bacterium]
MIALFQDAPTHPIHQMMVDDAFAEKVTKIFRKAFGTDLTVFRAGGSNFPLLVGERPKLDQGEDELKETFVSRLKLSTVPLSEQGDGMKSFTSIILHSLFRGLISVRMLDEPEAFLHPPQARVIGEFLSREKNPDSQLLIATHSSDVLEGLISGGEKKVRIIRIQRKGNVNTIKELSRDKVAKISNDTLIKYSNVLEGIFYQHVIVCESDSDCLFYQSILSTTAVSGDVVPDVLFIHGAGKHRVSQLSDTLRDLGVPVSVIVDIDILKEEKTMRELFESVGGIWSDIAGEFQRVKLSIDQKRPNSNADGISTKIREALQGVGGEGVFPKETEREIKKLLASTSAWDEIKRSGKSALSGGPISRDFEHIQTACNNNGLWIVPVGELEGFCKSVEGHGPSFVAEVLEGKNLESDPDLLEARNFMKLIWNSVTNE